MKKNILVFGLLLCVAKAAAQSPYIYKVWEYAPAPGQFVNTLPEYEPGDTPNTMRLKAEDSMTCRFSATLFMPNRLRVRALPKKGAAANRAL